MSNLKLEHQLQHECVMEFSQQFPEEKGSLFAVNNEAALGPKQAQQLKAIGVVAGVADLIYFNFDILIGIEVKVKGRRHDLDHVKQQLTWGRHLISKGGIYVIPTSKEAFMSIFSDKKSEDLLSIEQVEKMAEMLEAKGRKSIVF